MNILPYLLLRVSPDDFEDFDSLEISNKVAEECKDFSNQYKEWSKSTDSLSADIYEKMSLSCSKGHRTVLLSTKRLVLGKKIIPQKLLQTVQSVYPIVFLDQLQKYNSVTMVLEERKQNLVRELNDNILVGRSKFSTLIDNENLRRGLVLSSRSLLNQIDKCYPVKAQSTTSGKAKKIERTIIKYLSRIYCKTSPFSSFTYVGAIPVTEETIKEQSSSFSFEKQLPHEHYHNSCLTLNTNIFNILVEVLKAYPTFYSSQLLRLNPTLTIEENSICYLFVSNNADIFQRIQNNRMLSLIISLLTTRRERLTFNELAYTISKLESVEQDVKNIEKYLLRLIDYGMIIFDIPISGYDPNWDTALVNVIKQIDQYETNEVLMTASNTLTSLKEYATKYISSNSDNRNIIIQEAYNKLMESYLFIHAAAGLPAWERELAIQNLEAVAFYDVYYKNISNNVKYDPSAEKKHKHVPATLLRIKPQEMWFEDISIVVEGGVHASELEHIINSIQYLLDPLIYFDGLDSETMDILAFFLNTVGFNGSLSLLTLFQNYCQAFDKTNRSEVYESLYKTKIMNFENVFTDILNEHWNNIFDADTLYVNINKELFIELNTKLRGTNSRKIRTSQTAILQFFHDKSNKLIAVFNGLTLGYGKMFGRFLNIIDKGVENEIRKANIKSQKDGFLLVENCDSSLSNVNIHPSLLPFKITLPGLFNSDTDHEQVCVSDLTVFYDPHNSRLNIRNARTGNSLKLLDMGIQNPFLKTKLFNFIKKIAEDQFVGINSIVDPINTLYLAQLDTHDNISPNPVIKPRIYFNENLVLQRRSWIFKKEVVPQFEAFESEGDVFLRINTWRHNYRLPNRVFVRITKEELEEQHKPSSIKAATPLRNDDYKPQYINFNNPFLVNLLPDMFRRASTEIIFEEMLPGSNELFSFDGKKRVSEFCLQWYS